MRRLKKKDYEGALKWFDALLEKNPANTRIRLRYADAVTLTGAREQALEQYKIVADELAEAGFVIQAIAVNKKIARLDPSQSAVHEKLAALNEQRWLHRATPPTTHEIDFSREATVPAPPRVSPRPDAPERTTWWESLRSRAWLQRNGPASPAEQVEQTQSETAAGIRAPATTAETEAPSPAVSYRDPASVLAKDESAVHAVHAVYAVHAVHERDPSSLEDEPGGSASATASTSDEALAAGGTSESRAEEAFTPEASDDEPASTEEPALTSVAIGPTEVNSDEEVEIIFEVEPEDEREGSGEPRGPLAEMTEAVVFITDDVERSARDSPLPAPHAPSRIPLFSDLTAEEFVDIAHTLESRTVKADTRIIDEGAEGDTMFMITSGEVEASCAHEGRQIKLATLEEGEFFGEMSVLTGSPRSATVTATRNTELLCLSRSGLAKILERHPQVEAKIRRAHEQRITENRLKSPERRISRPAQEKL